MATTHWIHFHYTLILLTFLLTSLTFTSLQTHTICSPKLADHACQVSSWFHEPFLNWQRPRTAKQVSVRWLEPLCRFGCLSAAIDTPGLHACPCLFLHAAPSPLLCCRWFREIKSRSGSLGSPDCAEIAPDQVIARCAIASLPDRLFSFWLHFYHPHDTPQHPRYSAAFICLVF